MPLVLSLLFIFYNFCSDVKTKLKTFFKKMNLKHFWAIFKCHIEPML